MSWATQPAHAAMPVGDALGRGRVVLLSTSVLAIRASPYRRPAYFRIAIVALAVYL